MNSVLTRCVRERCVRPGERVSGRWTRAGGRAVQGSTVCFCMVGCVGMRRVGWKGMTDIRRWDSCVCADNWAEVVGCVWMVVCGLTKSGTAAAPWRVVGCFFRVGYVIVRMMVCALLHELRDAGLAAHSFILCQRSALQRLVQSLRILAPSFHHACNLPKRSLP